MEFCVDHLVDMLVLDIIGDDYNKQGHLIHSYKITASG
jgi:hypothetical protein